MGIYQHCFQSHLETSPFSSKAAVTESGPYAADFTLENYQNYLIKHDE
jgi:hypothetical protein